MISPATLLRAVRAPSLTAGAMPVLTAAALAVHEGYPLDVTSFAATLVGMVLVQSAVNLVNDYFDDRSGLDADPDFAKSPFPLGSRVIQQGRLSPRGVLILAGVCAAVAASAGVYVTSLLAGNGSLVVARGGAALGYFYTAPPLQIAYHGAGEPITFLLFGPLAGLGSYYVQSGTVGTAALVVSSVVGWLAMAILFLHHFPQHDADGRHGKKTPIVRLGQRRAGKLVAPMLAVPYVAVSVAAAAGVLPWTVVVVWLTAPLALRVSRTARSHANDPRRTARAVGGVLGVHFLSGVLLSVALVVA